MTLGDIREETGEDRTEQTGEPVNQPSLLTYLHDTQPEGEDACEPKGNLKSSLRRREGGIHHRRKHLIIAHHYQFDKGNDKGDEEKRYPNIIEYHTSFYC